MDTHGIGIHEYDSEKCRNILSQLPGIFAVRLRFGEGHDAQLTEIHVLASTDRNPKQIARDIQSTLFAVYGIELDHRIISIAQLPQDPLADIHTNDADLPEADITLVKETRLLFTGIDASHSNGGFDVNVHLACDGQDYSGTGHCRDTLAQCNRLVAQATTKAVNTFLGKDYFNALEVKIVNIWDVTVAVTLIEYQENDRNDPIMLVGAAPVKNNSYGGIVRSTLDGLNRCISKIQPAHALI